MGKLEILAHRGWWDHLDERNSPQALKRAFAAGLGIETDLRDCAGEIVIAHDPPTPATIRWRLHDLLEAYATAGRPGTLALNIKADGLTTAVMAQLKTFGVDRYLVFDMSIPDMLQWLQAGARVFCRQSEYEPAPSLLDRSQGVWLDAFNRDWFEASVLAAHLNAGRKVAIVSPELHQRDPAVVWATLASFNQASILLCTDRVADARRIFHGPN